MLITGIRHTELLKCVDEISMHLFLNEEDEYTDEYEPSTRAELQIYLEVSPN
jgi:hypothetical protein